MIQVCACACEHRGQRAGTWSLTCQYRQPKSGNAVLGEKSLVLERIWGHLALQLAEGTFENVEERPRFGWRRCGLVCNRKCTSWTVEPVLLLMPTLSDPSDGGWGTLNGFSQHSVCVSTHRSMRTGSFPVAFNLNTLALASCVSWQRMTIAPSVCLRGRAVRLLSMTSWARST